jgi:hypothetical protein
MPRPPAAPPAHGVRPTFKTPAKDVRARLQAIQSRIQDLNQLQRHDTISASEARGTLTSSLVSLESRARMVSRPESAGNNSSTRSLTVEEMERMFTSGLLRPLPPNVRSKLEARNDGGTSPVMRDMSSNQDELDQRSLSAAEMERMVYGDKMSSNSPKAAGSSPLGGTQQTWLRNQHRDAAAPSGTPIRPVNRIESLKTVRGLKSGRALMVDMRSFMNSDGTNNNFNNNAMLPGNVTPHAGSNTQVRGTANLVGRSPPGAVQDNIQSYINTYIHARPGDYTSPRMVNTVSSSYPSPRVPQSSMPPSSRVSPPSAPGMVPRPAHDSPFKRSKALQDDVSANDNNRGTPSGPVFGAPASHFTASPAVTNTSSRPLQDDFGEPAQTAPSVFDGPPSVPRHARSIGNDSPIRAKEKRAPRDLPSRAFVMQSNLTAAPPPQSNNWTNNAPAALQPHPPASDLPANISSATMFSRRPGNGSDVDSDSRSPERGSNTARSLGTSHEGNVGTIATVISPPRLTALLNEDNAAAGSAAVGLRDQPPRAALTDDGNVGTATAQQGAVAVGQPMQEEHDVAHPAEQRTASAHSKGGSPQKESSSIREDVQLSDS